MTDRDILLAAADHLEQHGWRQHILGQRGEPCCLIGALDVARPVGSTASALQAVADHLGIITKHPFTWLVEWNDFPGRTAAEVIAALRAAGLTTGVSQ